MALLVEQPVERPVSGTAAVALDLGGGAWVIGDEIVQSLAVMGVVGDDMSDIGKARSALRPAGCRPNGPV